MGPLGAAWGDARGCCPSPGWGLVGECTGRALLPAIPVLLLSQPPGPPRCTPDSRLRLARTELAGADKKAWPRKLLENVTHEKALCAAPALSAGG